MRSFFPILSSLAILSSTFAGPRAHSARLLSPDLLRDVADAGRERDGSVQEVRSLRRYTLRNPKWSSDVAADVLVTIGGSGREQYKLLNSNAHGLKKEILKKILEGEMEASSSPQQTQIGSENYDFSPLGSRVVNGHDCEAIQLVPKKKSKYLIDGWACIDMRDLAVVHLEGRTAKSVSFWVGRPYITQDFRKVGRYWYSAKSVSRADVKFFGATELTIDYGDYSIAPKSGKVLLACVSASCSPNLAE